MKKKYLEENKGFAHAVNSVLDEVNGDYFLQLDADIRIRTENLIDKMLQEFKEDTVAVWGAIRVENNDKFFPSMMSAAKRLQLDYLYGGACVMFKTEFIRNDPYDEVEGFSGEDFEMREKIESGKHGNKYAENVVVEATYPEGFVDNVRQRDRYSRSHVRLMKRRFEKTKLIPLLRDWTAAGGLLTLPFLSLKLWVFLLVSVLIYFSYRARVYDKLKFGLLSVFAELFFVFVRSFGYLRELSGKYIGRACNGSGRNKEIHS